MRFVTVVATPTEAEFHPLNRQLAEEPEITRRAIHQVELLEDGTCSILAEARGNLDRLREILANSPHVVEFSVTGEREGFSYTRYEANDLTERLLRRRRRSELVIQMPIELTADGALVATYVGTEAGFREGLPDEPEGVDVEIVRTGEYHPHLHHLFADLTERQQEVLEAAVRLGYYRNPREATHDDLAADLDLSPTTVGEHLRKVEATVFSGFFAG